MKILDIISEDPLAGYYMDPRTGMYMPGPAPAAAPTSSQTTTPSGKGTNPRSSLSRNRTITNKIERMNAAIELKKSRKAAQIAKKVNAWKQLLNNYKFTYVLWILGIADATYELKERLSAAEEGYADGDFTEEDLRDYRQYAFGIYTASFLIPALLSKLKIARIAGWIARILISGATLVGTAFTAPTVAGAVGGVAAFVAEQAFFTALQIWLSQPSTATWLAHNLFEPLIIVGKLPENFWNFLRDEVSGTDAYKDAIQAKEKEKQDPKSSLNKKDNTDVNNTSPQDNQTPFDKLNTNPQGWVGGLQKIDPNSSDTSINNTKLY
jgi:uncharacterized membrane protein YeaQ/YmgE (transglycosylase-associated protein family)